MRKHSLIYYYYPFFFEKPLLNYKVIAYFTQNILKRIKEIYSLSFFVERNCFSIFVFLSRALLLKKYLKSKNALHLAEFFFGNSLLLCFSAERQLKEFLNEIKKFEKNLSILALIYQDEIILPGSLFFSSNFSPKDSIKKICFFFSYLLKEKILKFINFFRKIINFFFPLEFLKFFFLKK